MSIHKLKGMDFLLGIDESWDSHIEVTVNFIEQISINNHSYYLFLDKVDNRSFYLSPRYIGQKIEDVNIEKRIVVNVSKMSLIENRDNSGLPITYATGLLEVLSKVEY